MFRLTALTVLLVAHAATPAPSPTKAAIAARYAGFNKALLHGDVIGAAKYMRPDYVCTLRNGPALRREDYLKHVFATLQAVTQSKSWMTINAIKSDPAGVMVTVHRFLMGRQRLEDNHEHAIKRISKYEDLWVPDGKRWLLKRSMIAAVASFIDGKPPPNRRVAGAARLSQAQR